MILTAPLKFKAGVKSIVSSIGSLGVPPLFTTAVPTNTELFMRATARINELIDENASLEVIMRYVTTTLTLEWVFCSTTYGL